MNTDDAKQDMERQIREAQEKIKAKAKNVHRGVERFILNTCLIVERTAKQKMTEAEVDSTITYGKRGHHPSIPGSAPAPDYGTERRSITHDIDYEDGRVVGRTGSTILNPPYPLYHETGTSRMLPRPWLLPSIEENREKIRALGKAVMATPDISIEDSYASD